MPQDDWFAKNAPKKQEGGSWFEKNAPGVQAKTGTASSAKAAASAPPQTPGYFKRLGQSLGVPTSMAELESAHPSTAEKIGGPAVTVGKMLWNYGKTAVAGLEEGGKEAYEAGENIGKGQPVLPNIAKAGYAVAHADLQATHFIGPSIETAGQDVAAKNYQGAAGGLTGVIGQVVVPEVIEKTPGYFRERLQPLPRKAAQILVGVTPEHTTIPLVEEFKGKVAETEQANRGTIEKYQTSKREALQKTEEQNAEHALSKEETKQTNALEQARVKEINDAANAKQGRRSDLAQSLKTGSKQLGEGIRDLQAKVKTQDDANYATIRAKVAEDPGVPLADMAREAHNAEKFIKGSTENIKQFRELMRKTPEAEGVQTSVGFVEPGDPLYERLAQEGAIDQGGNLPFDQLQGYSTEIGMKLAKGGLPGDVYQALKYMREKIDAAKQVIADRNGVGAELKAANKFHFDYMDTFFDKPSAVAASLDRVGKLDPEFYAEPFITGKAGQTGIGKLQKYDSNLANLATTLRESHREFSTLPEQSKIIGPRLKGEPEPPSPITVKKPELEPAPPRPTAGDVRASKAKIVGQKARYFGGLSYFDMLALTETVIAPLMGRPEGALYGLGGIGIKRGMGMVLDTPKVVKWLSEPSPRDLAILEKLDPAAKASTQASITNFAIKQSVKNLSPGVRQLLGPANVARIIAASTASIPKTPGEARARIQPPSPQ